MTKIDMKKLYKNQMNLARGCSWKTYKIVSPQEVDYEAFKLKMARVRYRTRPIYRNKQIVLYKIEVI